MSSCQSMVVTGWVYRIWSKHRVPTLMIIFVLLSMSCNQKSLQQKISQEAPSQSTTSEDPANKPGAPAPPKPISILVTPSTTDVAVGTCVRLSAIAVYPYGIMKDITDHVTWGADNPEVGIFRSYDPPNSLSTLTPGTINLTASYREVSGSTSLKVSPAKVVKLTPSPLTLSASGLLIDGVYTHEPVSFKVLATLSDGRIQELTNDVNLLLSANSPKVTLSNTNKGQVSLSGPVQSTITIKFENLTATLPITAVQVPPAPKFLTVSPDPIVIPNGITTPLSLSVTYTDNRVENMTLDPTATWTSSDPAKMQLITDPATAPKVKAKGTGQFQITAKYGGLEKSVAVIGTMGSLGRIDVSPSSLQLPLGSSATFTATGVYSDGSTLDLTKAVVWASNNLNVSFPTTEPKNVLTATTKPAASVLVTASYGGISGASTVTVSDKVLRSIAIRPRSSSVSASDPIPVGSKWKVQFAVTGSYSDGTTADLTEVATWSSQASSAPFGAISIDKGMVTGTTPGRVTLRATVSVTGSPTVNGTLPLTITERTLESLTIKTFPTEDRINPLAEDKAPLGKERWLGLFANYSDGSINQPVTKQASWEFESTLPNYSYNAYVLNSETAEGRWKGYVKGISVGTTKITASFGGLTASIDFIVTPKEIETMSINGNQNISLQIGDKRQLAVTLVYTDGSTQNLIDIFNDASLIKEFSNSYRVTIGSTASDYGEITAISEEAETINFTASFASNPSITQTVSWNVAVSSKCAAANGGIRIGYYCWFLSDAGQSCADRCQVANSDYHGVTASIDNSYCRSVLQNLFSLPKPPTVAEDTSSPLGLGCSRQVVSVAETDSEGNPVFDEDGNPLTTTLNLYKRVRPWEISPTASAPDHRRACACRER